MSFVIKWDPKDFPDTDVLLSSKAEGEPWPVFLLMGFLYHKADAKSDFQIPLGIAKIYVLTGFSPKQHHEGDSVQHFSQDKQVSCNKSVSHPLICRARKLLM